MELNNLRLFYLNIFLILFFILNLYSILIIIIFIRVSYTLNESSTLNEQLQFYHQDLNSEDSFYLDQDVEHTYWDNYINEEEYLLYNCRFFFDYYGGTQTLSFSDYYQLINNYRNIYISIYINKDFNMDEYELYDFIEFYKNKSKNLSYLNNLNFVKYNIINNIYNISIMDKLYKKKIYEKFK